MECQVYLEILTGPGAGERLTAVLAAHPVASVLIRPSVAQALVVGDARALVEIAQKRNVAAILADDPALARTLRADGVHLSAGADILARYSEARSIVGNGVIVGGAAGGSRHVAMELGEAGADYIAFGRDAIPVVAPVVDEDAPATDGDDGDAALEVQFDQPEMIAWWGEIFEVPCVAFDVPDAATAVQLAGLGADFVTVMIDQAQPAAETLEQIAKLRLALAPSGNW
jgi:thiamine-phosphate pyrophosphorylase